MAKFASRLDEALSRRRPAVIITHRGTTIQADHVVWVRGFLRVGISPGIHKGKPTNRILRVDRLRMINNPDFWEVQHTKTKSEAEVQARVAWARAQNAPDVVIKNIQMTDRSHTAYIPVRKFKHILTIRKENIKTIDGVPPDQWNDRTF